MSAGIVLGVDGGGTATRVALVALDGAVLGRGEAGPGNHHDVGVATARANLARACTAAWLQAERTPAPVDAAFLGLASVVSEADRGRARHIAEAIPRSPHAAIGLDHDLRTALAGALTGEPGIVLIAGTGSSCYGRRADGRSWRSGGWGSLLDDRGSSTFLGIQAISAVVRAHDGRGLDTSLRAPVLEALGVADMDEILHRVDGEGLSRSDLAALARLVTAAASHGDGIACEILRAGAASLAEMVAAVAHQLGDGSGPAPLPVAVVGGLTKAGAIFLDPLRIELHRTLPATEIVTPRLPPVLGAALLALELAGIAPRPAILQRMEESLTSRSRSLEVR